jgi:stage III sporulation protein AB
MKIVCLSLILIAAAAAGFYFRSALARRVLILREMRYALDEIILMIKFQNATLREIFEKLRSDNRLGALTFITDTLLGMDGGESFGDSYSAAVGHFSPAGLTVRDREIIAAVGQNLGSSNAEGQIANLSVMGAELETAYNAAHMGYIQKSKLYSSLGLLAGAFIVIVLI